MRAFALAAGTLAARELTRFARQRNRVIGALATPLLFWFFLGAGLGSSFRVNLGGAEGLNYLQFFLPGTMALVCLFTAIFSTISVIEDRQAGFLQAVLVSPAPRSAVVAGKMLGGTVLAVGQSVLFFCFLPMVGVPVTLGGVAAALAVLVLLGLGLTGLGLLLAWTSESVQGFHALMNLVLMPLWFLSGAVFPAAGAPRWLAAAMAANPVTYGVHGLHRALLGATTGPSLGACLAVMALFAVVMGAAATALVRRDRG